MVRDLAPNIIVVASTQYTSRNVTVSSVYTTGNDMWKYNIQDFKPCDALRPGIVLEFLPNTGDYHLYYAGEYGPSTFIKWIDECQCQDSCKKYSRREAEILTRTGELRTFHPLWFVECRKCIYFRR